MPRTADARPTAADLEDEAVGAALLEALDRSGYRPNDPSHDPHYFDGIDGAQVAQLRLAEGRPGTAPTRAPAGARVETVLTVQGRGQYQTHELRSAEERERLAVLVEAGTLNFAGGEPVWWRARRATSTERRDRERGWRDHDPGFVYRDWR